jgi:hypothetical protein
MKRHRTLVPMAFSYLKNHSIPSSHPIHQPSGQECIIESLLSNFLFTTLCFSNGCGADGRGNCLCPVTSHFLNSTCLSGPLSLSLSPSLSLSLSLSLPPYPLCLCQWGCSIIPRRPGESWLTGKGGGRHINQEAAALLCHNANRVLIECWMALNYDCSFSLQSMHITTIGWQDSSVVYCCDSVSKRNSSHNAPYL